MKNAGPMIALLALAGGCTDDGNTLQILQNSEPDEGCVVTSSTTGAIRTGGTIEVSSQLGYVLTPVVRNLAQNPGAGINATRVAYIEGYNVDISFPAGGGDGVSSELTSFSTLIGATVQPGGTTGFAMEIVPAALLEQLSVAEGDVVDLRVQVSLFGSMDGNDIQSNEYNYPVQVCNGCLLTNLGPCTDIASGVEYSEGGICNPLQDVPLECCTSSGGEDVCPAVQEAVQ